jgi:hypothetical protein
MAKHSTNLVAMLETEETEKGQKYTTLSQGTWASKVIPRFTFNQNLEHPNTIMTKNNANGKKTQRSHGSREQLSRLHQFRLYTRSHRPTQFVRPHSCLSGFVSVVSQMQSMATEQTRLLQTLIKKQEKQACCQEKQAYQQAEEQCKANADAQTAARQASENTMTMVVDSSTKWEGETTKGRPCNGNHSKDNSQY